MIWDAALDAALARATVRPRFAVEVFEGFTPGGLPGQPILLTEEIQGIQTQSSSVQPVSWSAQLGGWSVSLAHGAPQSLARYFARGAWMRLRCGPAGYPADPLEWPVIALGRSSGVTAYPRGIVVSAIDLVSSLASRPSRDTPSELPLFHDLAGAGSSTTISGTAYTVGDSTLYVANASSTFAKDGDTGGRGLVRITPSGGGDAFFLRWSAKNTVPDPDELTIDNPSNDVMGTTRANAAIGSTVEHLAYLQDHPSDCVRKLIVSSGGGGNGAYDTLPAAWGYVLPDNILDHGDIGVWKSRHMSTRSINLYSDTVQNNGYSWLSGALNPYGFFLCTRRGRVTVRAGITPWGQPIDATLTDEHISEIVSHELYDRSVSAQPAGCEVTGPTSTSTEIADRIATLPGIRYQGYDLSAYTVHSDEAGTLAEVRGTLARCLVVGERLTLRLAGLAYAGLTPWDHVRVSSRHLWGRLEEAGETWTDRPCRVVSVEVDWLRGGVTVELWAPPHWTEYDR